MSWCCSTTGDGTYVLQASCRWRTMLDSVTLVVRSSSLVRADVPGVVLDFLAPGHALALAALVEALLVAARVLARVRQTVDAADVHGCLQHTTPRRINTAALHRSTRILYTQRTNCAIVTMQKPTQHSAASATIATT